MAGILTRSAVTTLLALSVVSLAAIRQQKTPTNSFPFKLKTSDLIGEFNIGGGLGSEKLSITEDGKFHYEEYGCLGLMGSAKGTWHLDGDTLKLTNRAQRLVPIQWGKRIYLFEEYKISKEFDRFFGGLGHGLAGFPGPIFVKKPIPAMTLGDYDADPIIPDRYLAAWNASKLKYHKKSKA